MKQGERIQWACGHWLIAGQYGIQDDSVKDVPTKRCGACRDRLRDAAPQLLEALKGLLATFKPDDQISISTADCILKARDAIKLAKGQNEAA